MENEFDENMHAVKRNFIYSEFASKLSDFQLVEPKKQNDSQTAMLWNDLYGRKLKNNDGALNIKLLENVIDDLAGRLGVLKPQIQFQKHHSILSEQYGALTDKNEVFINYKFQSDKNYYGLQFGKLVEVVAHEMRHVYQYSNMKNYYKGFPTDKQTELMAVIDAMNRLIYQNQSKFSFYTYSDYFFKMQEIDARLFAHSYMIELSKNESLCSEAKKEIHKQLKESLNEDYLANGNIYTGFLKTVKKTENKFLKLGLNDKSKSEMGNLVYKDFQRIREDYNKYAWYLQISNATMQANAIKKAKNLEAQMSSIQDFS